MGIITVDERPTYPLPTAQTMDSSRSLSDLNLHRFWVWEGKICDAWAGRRSTRVGRGKYLLAGVVIWYLGDWEEEAEREEEEVLYL